MSHILIGVTGFAGSGKDTFSDELVLHHNFVKLEFARKIKEILSDLYDVPIQSFYDRVLKNTSHMVLGGLTPREACQRIGTEGFRNMISRSTWVNYLIRHANEVIGGGSSVVVSDVRFPDEFARLKEMGAIMVGIERRDSESHRHESEVHVTELIKQCDHVIANDKSLENYMIKIADFCNSVTCQKNKGVMKI